MTQQHFTMQTLPESERPYEKFLDCGPQSLSDAELLSIIMRSGTKGCNSTDLARRVLTGREGNLLNLYDYTYEELLQIPGIGSVKAIQLKSIAELSARISRTERKSRLRMDEPASVASYYMEQMRHQPTEILLAAYFDVKCTFLGDRLITNGSITCAFVSPGEIFRHAILCSAASVVLLHNHPSGDPTPSKEDFTVTKRVCKAGEILGIKLQDHIVIGDNCFFSFTDHGSL